MPPFSFQPRHSPKSFIFWLNFGIKILSQTPTTLDFSLVFPKSNLLPWHPFSIIPNRGFFCKGVKAICIDFFRTFRLPTVEFAPHISPSKAVAGCFTPSWLFLFWYNYGELYRIKSVSSLALMPFSDCFSRLFSICLQFVIAIHTFRMV